MTRPLLASLNEMAVVELDRDLVKRWQSEAQKNLTIYEADALKFDFLAWAKNAREKVQKNHTQAKVKIVGNLPYNISSPLLFHLMEAADFVDEQVFMLQAEVIERMVAQHGDSEYSRLSVMLQSRYHLENVLDVPPDAFDPPPKVDSAVVKMIPRIDLKLSALEYSSLASLVSMAFAQRRKVLRNNLSAVKERLNLSEETLALRAQDISVEDYITWACKLAHQ
jgi:16S rRNA (adenine1518-N6/adenine1519-N6)-dimethyltransferase